MANQDEPNLPLSNRENRKSADLLPRFYRTDSNKKFLSATLDQLTQPGTVKKITGFIGRQSAKSVKSSDVFLSASDKTRQDYQLEPSAVIQDYLGNTTFFKDYIDHINHISVAGGIVNNHERLNKQEFYSWNPHISWDKFVNFQQYYWLPYGPAPIEVEGQQLDIESTYTVIAEDEGDTYAYIFSPDGLTRNPALTLYRGQTYHFSIDTPNNPFSIKTARTPGELDRYTEGVSSSAIETGTLTFKVGNDSPDVLFYVSEQDPNVGGVLQVKDIDENSFLNLETDIIGKKTYTMNNGVPLSNGMKLFFKGNITPEIYSSGCWYVEGVGTAIKLVNEKDLEIISSFTEEVALLFDDEPFDNAPFSTLTSFPKDKDYIIINRSSIDRNPWSRNNRWFHQDIIIASANATGQVPELDQAQRATRPIIEFNAGLKLFNFGHASKENVDVIDTFTTDVFSTIEGSLGYNIDGVNLVNGMRVLFTADTDRFVNGKIFKVNFIELSIPGRIVDFVATTGVDTTTSIITFPTAHGLTTGNQIEYRNNGNTNIEGLTNGKIYFVVVVDTNKIKLYADKNLTSQVKLFNIGSGTHKIEVFGGLRRQINLVETTDSLPFNNQTILVKLGSINQGRMFWYNGSTWQEGQDKISVSQPPLFDVFDNNGVSYSNTEVYEGSNFIGTKLFSYKIGTGTTDAELKFPLSYQNINNIGDIVFDFNLLSDSFNYKSLADVLSKNTNVGYLKIISSISNFSYQNGWVASTIKNAQPIVRIFKESGLTNDFPIDVYDFKDQLDDLEIKVYINGKRQNRESFVIQDGPIRKKVVLTTPINLIDVLTLKCIAAQPKNENGHYEIPLNLQNNPLNKNITQLTLGEVIDHVDTIVENINGFFGTYPGYSNIRDLGNITPYGTRFVQHSSPLNLSLYHFGESSASIVNALDQARVDYGKFKRSFILFAGESGIDTDPRRHVDFILEEIAKDKTKTQPYYLSDMFPHSGSTRLEYVVLDSRVKTYPLTAPFNLLQLSNRAVGIYINGYQLVHGRDYLFGDDVFFEILVDLNEGDLIEAFEYETTDGSFCPSTPTKLGLYPAYEPSIYIDNSYLEPTKVIQGHDGSIVIAYDDYRDALILELEMRIFNNIKIKYDPQIFNLYNIIPGYSRTTPYDKTEFDKVLSQYFFQWITNINKDYTSQDNALWDRLNPFTWNYRENYTADGTNTPAFWRGIYRWTLDTDRPDTHPWECLGFPIKPKWWNEVYGPAPYTSNNYILWDDIKNGIIRQPGSPVRTSPQFAKPILATGVPVDENGNLLDPYNAGQVSGYINPTPEGYYVFGDCGPVESAWRRSSYYAFALIETALLLQPSYVLGTCLDRSRIVRNLNNQLVYRDTDLRISLSDIKIPSTTFSIDRVFTSGLINYIVDYITSDVTTLVTKYSNDLSALTNKLSSKLGGFTSKPKFRLLLDSKNVSSSGGVFIPEENYNIVLNTSSPVKKVFYSGVVITKYADGYEVKGYNNDNPYFTYYPYTLPGKSITVGGISESFMVWESNKYYAVGKLIKANNQYYRVKISHQSGNTFDNSYYTKLAELPVTGGRSAEFRKAWNSDTPIVVGYGTKFKSIQDMVDFLQGYSAYLENEGFVFDEFNPALKNINNWESAIKEFLFWTTQNWAVGAVLSLSPSAGNLVFRSVNSVVNNVLDRSFDYQIFKVDGQPLQSNFVNSFREGNTFTLSPSNTVHGIYGATLYLVQKEHVLLLDNTTLFNDIVYDQVPGYRQERIKIIGYISTNWNGSFNIPGFIYDQAILQIWEPWTDYRLGDVVKYKEFYYSANNFLPGTDAFVSDKWIKLNEQPTSRMIPNWDYKADQFADFYSLDSDNFDVGQQKMAQHLIGYQKRQYLENIIQDDVSQYKFYQGMIIEKGTQNVFSKLFDVLSADGMESLTFNEEWAIRVGNYGAVDSFNEIEFKLDESLFKLTPQPFELVSSIDPTVVDFVYRQLPTDVYIKPIGYTNNLWSTDGTVNYLRTPGYVRYEDVKLNIDSLDNILSKDITLFQEGNYVWCAFEERDWNIYRFTKSKFNIESVNYSNKTLTITCDRIANVQAGDILGITNSTSIAGFYKITSVNSRNILIETTIANWQSPFTDQILTFQFYSVRAKNVYNTITGALISCAVDNINEIIPTNLQPLENIWVDDNGAGLYSVFTNTKVFNKKVLADFTPASNAYFGKTIGISPDGSIAVVASTNSARIYSKDGKLNSWIAHDVIKPPDISDLSNLNFASDIKFSPDGYWLAISAKTASNVNGSGYSNQGYVALYYRATSINYEFAQVIVSQDESNNEFFGSKLSFAKTSNNTFILAVSAIGHGGSDGKVYFYKQESGNIIWSTFVNPLTSGTNDPDQYGYSISLSANGNIFAASAPNYDNNAGAVYLYKLNTGQYEFIDLIDRSVNTLNLADEYQFGNSIDVSANGKLLVVGAPYATTDSLNDGTVYVFSLGTTPSFNLHQTIVSVKTENFEKFGFAVNFMKDDNSLVIFSANGDTIRKTVFDTPNYTTFDNSSLQLVDIQIDSGRVDIFDRYNNNFIYGETLETGTTTDFSDAYGSAIAVSNDIVLVGAPNDNDASGTVLSYTRPVNSTSWNILHQENPRPNAHKIKKAFIYNRTKNELTSYLDVVDPIQGKIPGPADQEISYKTYFDPATYSIGDTVIVNGLPVNVDSGLNWTTSQVGMVWWDLTRAKFLDNQCGNVVYRSTTWNKLYETASIDIYEWIETKYLPSEWDKLSGTDKGDALSISGKSRYGDAVYSVKKKYDTISKSFQSTYYYWVKNSTVVSKAIGRNLSAYNISRLIADPISEGYTCLALTGTDSFSLVNVPSIINSTDYNLTIQYWLVDDRYTGTNAHSQWKVISEHVNTVIPIEIEKKWIHSLTGKDDNDRVVPDINLPFKQRYGVSFRPRQSMFINRTEALKQFIERVNLVLSTRLIVDEYDLTDLKSYNLPPSDMSGEWDVPIDTDAELKFVGVATLQQADLRPIIKNGRIIGAIIVNSGAGYVNAPYVVVKSKKQGRNARLRTVINVEGQVIDVKVLNPGEGYLDNLSPYDILTANTILSVRPYTVLVNSDANIFDKWSTYQWDAASLKWERTRGQSFDVNRYWNYTDWYANGYTQFTKIDHVVNNTYELTLLESSIGQIVKVKNIGSGGWLLLEQYNNLTTIDYTQNFKVVGRNNGTIQFSNSLYTFNGLGYDSVLFDSTLYDNVAYTELKIIIETIKNKILVDELRTEYLKLFFASIRYVLSEQTFSDWVMKTSFVKATHNVGELVQKVNYNSDNLQNFEDYIKEVKPYRTQIREYISSYTKLDPSYNSISDFDLLPIIDPNFKVVSIYTTIDNTGTIQSENNVFNSYPWKHWYDNVGFTVQDIFLIDGGSGYITQPTVNIQGGFGSGAVAKAYIANGSVNRIQLVSGGTGYLKAPLISIEGGLSEYGVAARAAVKIESEVVRSNKITIKFDRITRTYYVTELTETETFVGTGSRLQWPLRFSPLPTVGTNSVKVKGVDILRNEFLLTTKTSTSKGFTSYSGSLTLQSAPDAGSEIVVNYTKNFNHLSAADRINFYYNPESGMYGKDLAQLMTGIDYGGVSITGIGFNISGGWDSLPWFTDSWDGFDAAFDDYIVIAGASTYTYTLPYAPVLNEKINVYVNGVRIDDPYFNTYDGVTEQPNGRKVAPTNTVMQTIVGNGSTKIFTIPNLTLVINAGDTIIFRKSTSDGSFTPLPGEYDTQLKGGDIAYSTATGLAPDDIILDGDGLITPTSSAAPEEIVPGHITDAVAIKVYQLPTAGSAKIMFKNYIGDGNTTNFELAQIPNNFASIFVKLDNNILKQNIDYTVNWQNKTITMLVAPADKSILSIITFGVASQDLLDSDYFISDGLTSEYITKAPWIDTLGSIVLVDGQAVNYELFRTNESYDSPEKTGIRIVQNIPQGSLITYMITADQNQSASIIKSETFVADGLSQTLTLSNIVGNNLPLSNNVIVIKDNRVLSPSSSAYFTLTNDELTYNLKKYKENETVMNPANFKVYLDGDELNFGADYIYDVPNVSITINKQVYKQDSTLTVVNFTNAEYTITADQITFTSTLSAGNSIEVISMFNHNVEDIQRTSEYTVYQNNIIPGTSTYYSYQNVTSGKIILERMVAFDDYVWVIKNGSMLTHSVDYYLDSDLTTIRLKDSVYFGDKIDIICFNDHIVNHSYGYMQFKDMLNRVHYKRISKAKSTRLAKDLLQKDATITVVNGEVLSPPNPELNLPGIIEINGERIEYFSKTGNILGQLRRGTLGTGAPTLHRVRTIVLDIGPTETIPYMDKHVVETFISNGSTNSVDLNYNPTSNNSIDIFVGGYRLKKNLHSLFKESNGYPYSPEGDSSFDAEFTVSSNSSTVQLTNTVPENSKIVVVKKIGQQWDTPLTDPTHTSTDIINFIKNTEAVFSQYLEDKYQYILSSDDNQTLTTDDNDPLELD